MPCQQRFHVEQLFPTSVRNPYSSALWSNCFRPQVGHIHAGCSKEVTVTFCSSEPVTLGSQLIKCKICQVEFQQPLDQVVDWDDRKRTVQWLDSPQQTRATPEPHVKNKVGPLSAVWKVLRKLAHKPVWLDAVVHFCTHAGCQYGPRAQLHGGGGNPVGPGAVHQSSLWLCAVQLQHRGHSLQRYHALPKQTLPVSHTVHLAGCKIDLQMRCPMDDKNWVKNVQSHHQVVKLMSPGCYSRHTQSGDTVKEAE